MMDTTNTESKSHEHLVRAMRAHWGKESSLRSEANPDGANKEKERGDQVFSALVAGNKPLLTQYARSYFGGDDSLVTDGVQELVLALYQELRNLAGNTHALLWESRFGFCLKALAHALFVRQLQKRYGKARPEKDPDNPEEVRPYFEQKQTEFLTEADDFDPIGSAPDPVSAETIPRLLQNAELRALLPLYQTPHNVMLSGYHVWDGNRNEFAEHLGCSVKTVYNWIAKATTLARAWAQERYRTHGEFSDFIGS